MWPLTRTAADYPASDKSCALRGPKGILGNHITIRADGAEDVYAVVAHLQRGSASVAVGDRVERGQPIAKLGNSGNSSEPHVHLQLMDHPNPLVAAGRPLTFDRFVVDGDTRSGVPGTAQSFVTG